MTTIAKIWRVKTMKNKIRIFLENIEDIETELQPWLYDTNIFSILKMDKLEIRHSNFLAYLFDSNETHGLKDTFFKNFVINCLSMNDSNEQFDVIDIFLNHYLDLEVYRERRNIDLLIISKEYKIVLCIENKVEASESNGQLDKYKLYVDETYPDFKRLFVFLTPDGSAPSNSNWNVMTYRSIINILEALLLKHDLDSKIEMIIKDYIDVLKRSVTMDEELQRICQRIYKEHKDVLELIFENKPDNMLILKEYYVEAMKNLAAKDKIIFNENDSVKSLIRFKTPKSQLLFPDTEKKGGWGNNSSHFFEIDNRSLESKYTAKIKLVFTSNALPVERKIALTQLLMNVDDKKNREGWKWWSTKKTFKLKVITNNLMEEILVANNDDDNATRTKLIDRIAHNIESVLSQIDEYLDVFARNDR